MTYWSLVVFTLFWGIVGLVVPWFIPRGPNKGIIQVMVIETAFCCYLYWLCTWLMQLHPLIGPQLSSSTLRIMKHEWS